MLATPDSCGSLEKIKTAFDRDDFRARLTSRLADICTILHDHIATQRKLRQGEIELFVLSCDYITAYKDKTFFDIGSLRKCDAIRDFQIEVRGLCRIIKYKLSPDSECSNNALIELQAALEEANDAFAMGVF